MTTTTRELDRIECIEFLESRSVGRLGLSISALPTIEPVRRYHVVGDEILLIVSGEARVEKAMCFNIVSFEVDDLDADGLGQHVVVVGRVVPASRYPFELVAGTVLNQDESLFVLRCELMRGRSSTNNAVDVESEVLETIAH
jgi:hypothetical protein